VTHVLVAWLISQGAKDWLSGDDLKNLARTGTPSPPGGELTDAEATATQQLEDWIASHIRAFEFFGGVPAILVPEHLKAGVTRSCRYGPDINPTYHDLSVHYGTVVIPARPKKPKDKAKVENAVLIAERWILAALRHHRFFSLNQANEAVREKLIEFNNRKFQKLDTTRSQRFEDLDRPALRPLPPSRYELARWSKARVNCDYHVEVAGYFYSVPYQLVGHLVEVRQTQATIEVLHKGRRVASHARSHGKRGATTLADHMPRAHREHLEWTPSRLLHWAEQTRPSVARLVGMLLENARHPDQAHRPCLGLLRLGHRYGSKRLEAASRRAIAMGACSYKSVRSILETKLDQETPVPPEVGALAPWPLEHANVRGPDYYQ
jgi:transposase